MALHYRVEYFIVSSLRWIQGWKMSEQFLQRREWVELWLPQQHGAPLICPETWCLSFYICGQGHRYPGCSLCRLVSTSGIDRELLYQELGNKHFNIPEILQHCFAQMILAGTEYWTCLCTHPQINTYTHTHTWFSLGQSECNSWCCGVCVCGLEKVLSG